MAHTLTGEVSAAHGSKTIVVSVKTRKTHPLYKKQYSSTKKFMAHDEKNVAKVGDQVIIAESRPLSARKRWTLVKIVEVAHIKHVEAEPEQEPKDEVKAEESKK